MQILNTNWCVSTTASADGQAYADPAGQPQIYLAYIKWETVYVQRDKGPQEDRQLKQSVYERAILAYARLGDAAYKTAEAVLWLQYAGWADDPVVLQRASRACPQSGTIWSRLMLLVSHLSCLTHLRMSWYWTPRLPLACSMQADWQKCLLRKRQAKQGRVRMSSRQCREGLKPFTKASEQSGNIDARQEWRSQFQIGKVCVGMGR